MTLPGGRWLARLLAGEFYAMSSCSAQEVLQREGLPQEAKLGDIARLASKIIPAQDW